LALARLSRRQKKAPRREARGFFFFRP
jgi:hypothetical protein